MSSRNLRTDAWIRKLTTELADRTKIREVMGHDPISLPDVKTDLAPSQGANVPATNEEEAA